MTNEFVHSACERALALSSVVEQDSLREIAFGQILARLLSDNSQLRISEDISVPRKSNANGENPGKTRPGGLKARLTNLQQDGFFSEPRDAAQVAAELKAFGWTHATKEISARLQELSRERVVRRSANQNGRKGSYVYSNW